MMDMIATILGLLPYLVIGMLVLVGLGVIKP